MDKTSLLCGPIRSMALVLALLNANKLKDLIPLYIILTDIQFGHLFLAIIKINITVPIVHTRVLGALYDP